MKNLPIGISTLRTIINNDMVYIDKTAGVIKSTEDLRVRILDIFRRNADRLGLSLRTDTDIPGMLGDIIGQAAAQYDTPAVLLVDEYDKPLLDNIENFPR